MIFYNRRKIIAKKTVIFFLGFVPIVAIGYRRGVGY